MYSNRKNKPLLIVTVIFLTAFLLAATQILAARSESDEVIIDTQYPTVSQSNIAAKKDETSEAIYIPEPTQTVLPEEEEPALTESRAGPYAAVEYTDEDIELLAKLVYLEAGGECFEGQQAVAEVVLNRVLDQVYMGYANTISEIIFDNKYGLQFSVSLYIDTATPGDTQYEAVYTALSGESPVTELDVLFFSTAPYNNKVYAIIGNHYFCRV